MGLRGRTEAGVLPADWEAHFLGGLGVIRTGPFGTLLKAHEYSSSDGVPMISVGEIGEGVVRVHDRTPLIPPAVVNRLPEYVLREGDIVLGRKGAVDRTAVILAKQSGWFLGSDGLRVRLSRNCHAPFVGWQLQRGETRAWLLQNATGTTMPSMNQQILKRVPIALPPLPEQRAISVALGDVDALLVSLEKLIAKKCDLRQAAMQQLLTGTTRLPGFTESWRTRKLGEVLKVRHGKSQRSVAVTDGRYPILATGGEIGRTNISLYDKPSVLIGRKGTIDAPQFAETPFWTIDTLFFTEISESTWPRWVFYKFKMINWRGYNEASGVPSLNASTIEGIEVSTPPLAEQKAISAALADMDAELDALVARQKKTRHLKQGMMQELLTGRVRLVPKQEAA